jgi:hypothetical protein
VTIVSPSPQIDNLAIQQRSFTERVNATIDRGLSKGLTQAQMIALLNPIVTALGSDTRTHGQAIQTAPPALQRVQPGR